MGYSSLRLYGWISPGLRVFSSFRIGILLRVRADKDFHFLVHPTGNSVVVSGQQIVHRRANLNSQAMGFTVIDREQGMTRARHTFIRRPIAGSVALYVAKKSTNSLCSGP